MTAPVPAPAVADRGVEHDQDLPTVRGWLLLSAACLGIQLALTPTGSGVASAPHVVFWFAIGAFLLWLVHRHRSRTARIVVVVLGIVGAVLHGRDAVLVVLFLGQALPLLTPPVRRHVQHRP